MTGTVFPIPDLGDAKLKLRDLSSLAGKLLRC